MSDSVSDSVSSSNESDLSRRGSIQHAETNGEEVADITDNTEEKKDEEHISDNIAASVSDRVSTSMKDAEDEILHLEWQHDQNSDVSNHEVRLIDFVIIPGVYGNSKSPRQVENPGSGSTSWVTEFAKGTCDQITGPRAPEDSCRVLRFNYESNELFSDHRSADAIHRIALRLLNSLRLKRRDEEKKRLIYLIADDVGGVIVKDALVTASLDLDSWRDTAEMSRVLYPHRHHGVDDFNTRLASFFYRDWAHESGKARPPIASLSGLAKAVTQVNGMFIASHVALRSWVISLYPRGADGEGAFDEYCTTLGIPLEQRLPAPTDSDYSRLYKHLWKLEPDVREPRDRAVPSQQYVQERRLLATASPIYPLRSEIKPNPLAHSSLYQSWLECPSPQILYIHGSHVARDIAEAIFYDLEHQATKVKRRANVLYFSFDRWDVRADSIRDMLATFLAQICNHHPRLGPAINRLWSQIDDERGWTETDLIQFFEMFRISAEVEQTMIVINYFDECTKGSRKRFIDHISRKHYNDETPWKIVVTSHEPGTLTEELSGPFSVEVDITCAELEIAVKDSFESDIQQLLQSRGDLGFQEEGIRDQLHFTKKLNPTVRHIIFEQLRIRKEWPYEISTNDVFGSLELGEEVNKDNRDMASVLSLVLRGCSDQRSLDSILPWLLYAVRPLTIWELATVASFSNSKENDNLSPSPMAVEKLVKLVEHDFVGILEVDHNEVKFKHPCLHEIMVNTDASAQAGEGEIHLWKKPKGVAHRLIQSMCLDYLSRDAVREYVKKTFAIPDTTAFETPPFPDRTNLTSYAIQAWAHHYCLSDPLPDLSAISNKKDFVLNLAKAQWCLANPATKRSPCFQSLFPIFAGLGLPTVVEPLGSDDALRGLVEAASKEQKGVTEYLLGEYDFTSDELWIVLQAASSSGNEDLMNSLLDTIEAKTKIPDDFEWPAMLIYRAANLGHHGFAERLLRLGCSPDPDVESRNSTSLHASPLWLAACHGHSATVETLLNHGASLDFASYLSRNPLHKAALEGHPETVKVILRRSNVNIDCASESGYTALYLAVLGGVHRVVKLLLENDADPNMGIADDYCGNDRWSPLITATDDGFKSCIRLLLDNGANPNISGPSGPPLYWAVARGRIDILDMLLEAGANPRSERLQEPLLFTAINNISKVANLDMLERLLELGLDVNCKDCDGAAPLAILALSYGDKAMDDRSTRDYHQLKDSALKLLLDHEADPNLASTLHKAINKEQQRAVEMLLEAGADPNAISAIEGSALLCAAEKESGIFRLLLQKAADPDQPYWGGFTPLTHAACFGHEKIVELLLEYGATVDLEYGKGMEETYNDFMKGWTPLMCAARQGHGDIVRLLAEAGSDLQRIDVRGWAVIDLAIQGGVLSTLLEFPSKLDLDALSKNGVALLHVPDLKIQDLKRLINAGADVDIRSQTGQTPLGVFASTNLENVKYLVKRGANVNLAKDDYFGTPLHHACRKGRFDTIKFLVENGANMNATCDWDGTPLQALLQNGGTEDAESHQAMVHYLLSGKGKASADVTMKAGLLGYALNAAAYGSITSVVNLVLDHHNASIDCKDDLGRTPLHMAACSGLANFEVILARDGDINLKDNGGRTALHWAAQTGRFQVVMRIIELMRDKLDVDIRDIDSWTPLCWALRNSRMTIRKEAAGVVDIVKLLLEHGAKTDIVARHRRGTWTPLDIAYYYKSDPEVINILKKRLVTSNMTSIDDDDREVRDAKVTRRTGVDLQDGYCDYCLSYVCGLYWECEVCKNNFWLCDKCYQQAGILHPAHGDFTLKGEEEGGDDEQRTSATGASGSSDVSSNSGSSSDDSDRDEDEDEKEDEKEQIGEDHV
ncbi:hypothetical protein FLONG3_5209 [Fusarium longipes]|uniref:Nephrocystin 3-like N-terminal domain-containing protein n=1 Tax=Fusarium longipes TaxID=694270 RepID=A0A395SVN8_9HYPO|nr:hypothetical protein FLONG3_5209 [Fusarium longipes]